MDEDTAKMNEEFSRLQVPLASDAMRHVRRYVRTAHEPELEDYYFSNFTLFRWADGFTLSFSSRAHPCARYTLATLYFKLRSFVSITVTLTTLLNVGLSVGATALCIAYGLVSDLPITFISASVIFPISFGISFNFQRRETTVREVASLKALCLSMFMGSRDWPAPSDKQRECVKSIRDSLGILLTCARQTMVHNTPPGGSVQVRMQRTVSFVRV